MTVSSEQSSVTYVGNGVTLLFAIPYYFLDKTHITVSLVSSTGVDIPKVLDVDYTVAGAGNQAGGSLTFTVAPPNNSILIILREVPVTQLTDYQPNDDFPAESHERALDKLTMISQQLVEDNGRALKHPVNSEHYQAEARRIVNMEDPVDPQDAATRNSVEVYVGTIIATGSGPFNLASNVLYIRPDGVPGVVQDLSNKVDPTKGANLIGFAQFGLQIPGGAAAPAKGFWTDVDAGANIWRLRDRLLMGAAAVNDGKLFNTDKDWLTIERHSTTTNSQLAVLSTIGQTAGLFASRSSDINLPGGMGCIGAQVWAINDNTVALQTVYGIYGEVHRKPGTETAHGFEFDIVNLGSIVDIQSYQPFVPGLTAVGWFASGGDVAGATSASAAIAIVNNGANFKKGIVFHSTSLQGTDGLTGSAVAIQFAKGHLIEQVYTGGLHGSSIGFDVSNSGAAQNMVFSDIGLIYRNNLNFNLLHVSIDQTAVNGLNVVPGATGTGVNLKAEGGDANIDIRLEPAGTGLVDFRNPQVVPGAGAQFGYFSVKINGTIRKIPIYNV